MRRLSLLLLVWVWVGFAGCVSAPDDSAEAGPVAEAADASTDIGASETEDANKAIVSAVSGNEVWMGQLNRGDQWSIGNLHNITTRPGYDNQPSFVANGSGVYYTSIRDGAQADIYLFEDSFGAGFRYTSTPQSEFSPMALPAEEGISVVRVEADGKQGLWSYADAPVQLLPDVNNLGYYTWLDSDTVAMFLVTEPPTLALATISDGAMKTVNVEPGRSLAPIPGTRALSFVDKSDENSWWISRYDRDTEEIQQIAPTLEGSEDFAWTPDGELLMAQGKKIYVWRDQWDVAVDLDGSVAGEITRIKVGPRGRQIVFVAAEGPR